MYNPVRPFTELDAGQQARAGGKGGTLARLYQAGYPVPDGFVILPDAFDGDALKPEARRPVEAQLARLRRGGYTAFAVRSSALSEDSAQASFGGQFETVLDVRTDAEVRDAIATVQRSRHSARVQAYSRAKGLELEHEVAVVVQRLVPAELAGVLFTADPVSGDRTKMRGNFVHGLGEQLVSGEADADEFMLARPGGAYTGPDDLKALAQRLYRLGERLEKALGYPQDIEWAVAGGKLYLLQSRPITTLVAHDPATGEWNDSLGGDYLWSNQSTGEIFTEVMTPGTRSVWKIVFDRLGTKDLPGVGIIGGRPYMNVSFLYSFLKTFMRSHDKTLRFVQARLNINIPEGMRVPEAPMSLKTLVFGILLPQIKLEWGKARLERRRAEVVGSAAERCRRLRAHIEPAGAPALIALWRGELKPLFTDLFALQDASNEQVSQRTDTLQKELTALVGEADANALLASTGTGELASLGPLVGLTQVARGEMTRETYIAQYGHRGPYENYLYIPRPVEDPGWLDAQLRDLAESPVDVNELLAKRRAKFETAWRRLQARYPQKAGSIKRKIDGLVEASHEREAVRAELTRVLDVIRAWFLRAGALTGVGDEVFFLTYPELIDALTGDDSALIYIPARRKTHQKYQELPPYPALIRGRFDPLQWAKDPDRRSDVFDAHAPVDIPDTDAIKGYPGSAGRAEGVVRRIDRAEQGDQIRPGEILVTATTNVGWTPLFPRIAAVVTDIGAPLSHAAIIARELGIPAVVGCGNATMKLQTGDRVRVDGGRGIVEILT
ncbi:MAG: pyruvate, phosphate dikinase [Anaerolineae bacterium]|nr:pyruvate, phosphate dikinase [Anaerolineae bacterium]